MPRKPTYKELEQRIRELEHQVESHKEVPWDRPDQAAPAGELYAHERLFKTIFESSPMGMELYDKEGRLMLANPACCEIFGIMDIQEVLEFNLFDDPNVTREVKDRLKGGRISAYEVAFDFEKVRHKALYQTSRSGISHLNVTIIPLVDPDKGIHGYLVHVQDITEQKQDQEALQQNKDFLRTLLDAIPIPVFYKDKNGKYLGFNRAFEQFFGEPLKRLIGRSVFDLNPPDLAEIYHAKDAELFERGGTQQYESQVINAQGMLRDVLFHKAVFKDSEGDVAGLVGGILDITERKRVETALQEKTRELHERVKELHCLYWISSLRQDAGMSLSELLQKVVDFIPSSWRYSDVAWARLLLEDQAYKTNNFEQTPWKLTSKIVVSEESRGVLEVGYLEKRPFLEEEGHMLNAVAEILGRIIERVRMREEKRRLVNIQYTQMTEAIATLAGGVAHEFNNAVMAILSTIELLEMRFPQEMAGRKYFESIKRSSQRISRLTGQLLAYAQGGTYHPKHLELDKFLAETLPIVRHQIKPAVRIKTDIPKDLGRIRADRMQMQTVLSAVLTNCDEAIADKGLVRISAQKQYIDEEGVKEKPRLTPGEYVCLCIEDNGKGMSQEEQDRILEPFFTTKFQGRGMGMAAVYGIVRNHDGWISVNAELGKGTVVRIYLPAA